MKAEQLIQSLIAETRGIVAEVEKLKALDLSALTWRPSPASWNTLECLEHLNLYGDFYLPEIEKQINHAKRPADQEFKSGVLGAYFAKSMLPKAKLNKMKTFKDKDPMHAKLELDVIDRFLHQQAQLLDLLDRSRKVSLNRVKTSISITKWIKIRLGDTFQFYINHMLRHLQQIERIQAGQKETTKKTPIYAAPVH